MQQKEDEDEGGEGNIAEPLPSRLSPRVTTDFIVPFSSSRREKHMNYTVLYACERGEINEKRTGQSSMICGFFSTPILS